MSKNTELLKELVELKTIEEIKHLLKKDEPKKPPDVWWVNPIRLWLVLVLLFPFVGKAYMELLNWIWMSAK